MARNEEIHGRFHASVEREKKLLADLSPLVNPFVVISHHETSGLPGKAFARAFRVVNNVLTVKPFVCAACIPSAFPILDETVRVPATSFRNPHLETLLHCASNCASFF